MRDIQPAFHTLLGGERLFAAVATPGSDAVLRDLRSSVSAQPGADRHRLMPDFDLRNGIRRRRSSRVLNRRTSTRENRSKGPWGRGDRGPSPGSGPREAGAGVTGLARAPRLGRLFISLASSVGCFPEVAKARNLIRYPLETVQSRGRSERLGEEQAFGSFSIAGGPLLDALNFSNWRGPSVYLNPGETLSAEDESALKNRLIYEFVGERSVYFGPPERIVDLHRQTGISSVVFKTSWPGLPHAAVRECVRRLGTEVIPAVRAALRGEDRAVAAE